MGVLHDEGHWDRGMELILHRGLVQQRRGSLRRLGARQLALGQLHWSVARYAPPLERALWDGLAAMYDEVCRPSLGINGASCC